MSAEKKKVTTSLGPGDVTTYGDVHVTRIGGANARRRTEEIVALELGQAYEVARSAGRIVLQPVLMWPQGEAGEIYTSGDRLPKGEIPGVPGSGYLVISEAPGAFPNTLQQAQRVQPGVIAE